VVFKEAARDPVFQGLIQNMPDFNLDSAQCFFTKLGS